MIKFNAWLKSKGLKPKNSLQDEYLLKYFEEIGLNKEASKMMLSNVKEKKAKWKKIEKYLIGAILLVIIFYFLYTLIFKTDSQPEFICPENYHDSKKLDDDTYRFVKDYMDKNPNLTVSDLATYRYSLLVKNNCLKTLENIRNN